VVVGDLEHRAKKKIQILSVNLLAPMSDAPPRRVHSALAIKIAQDQRHRALTQIHFFFLMPRVSEPSGRSPEQ
jgi:hypothetical protein